MQYYKVDVNLIASVVQTLKEIDVRGYDSMNRIVGMVTLFEEMLNHEPLTEEEPKEEGK